MIYQGGSQVENRGLALSDDGITWTKYEANPFITKDSFPIKNVRDWDTLLLYLDETYFYYMEPGSLNGTNLYLTTREGSLRK